MTACQSQPHELGRLPIAPDFAGSVRSSTDPTCHYIRRLRRFERVFSVEDRVRPASDSGLGGAGWPTEELAPPVAPAAAGAGAGFEGRWGVSVGRGDGRAPAAALAEARSTVRRRHRTNRGLALKIEL